MFITLSILLPSLSFIASNASAVSWSPNIIVYSTSGVRYVDGDIAKGANFLYAYANQYDGDVYIKRSSDGVTWSSPTTVWSSLSWPTGGFCVYTVSGRDQIICSALGYVAKSTDNGTTFSSLTSLGSSFDYPGVATNASMDSSRVYDNNIYIAGNIGTSGIYLKKSTDNGATWSVAYQITNVQSYGPVLIRDKTRLYCLFSLASNQNVYIENSSDWGKTWGVASKVYTHIRNYALPGHAQYIDNHRCLLTIEDMWNQNPFDYSRGLYGYFWFGNATFQPVGCETGSTYDNPDIDTYAGIAFNDPLGVNYTSLWCYYTSWGDFIIETHYSHNTGLDLIPHSDPYIKNNPAQGARFLKEYSFNASATPPDNGSSTWSLRTNASWLSLKWSDEANCLIDGTATAFGSYWVNLTVSDLDSLDYMNWTVRVGAMYVNSNSEFASMATLAGWPGDGTAGNPYVIGNYFINASGYADAIYIGNTTLHFVVSDCECINASNAAIELNNVTNGTIINSLFNDSMTNTGFPSYVSGIDLENCINTNISGNKIIGFSAGIYSWHGANLSIFGNDISHNGWMGGIWIDVGSNHFTIIGNNISENEGVGISASASDVLVTNNTIAFDGGCGITLGYCSFYNISANYVAHNGVVGSGLAAISVSYSAHGTIMSNLILNNSNLGIDLFDDYYGRIILNSLIDNNGSNGTYNPSHPQARTDNNRNYWNASGYGNYWGDWTTPDAAPPFGIVDIPYSISGNASAKDNYPLTAPPGSPDIYPPVTTPSLTGAFQTNGWCNYSSVAFNLSADDWGSGVNATYYRIGTSGSWNSFSSPILFSAEGSTIVQFYSRDNAGNSESIKSITIKIDETPPAGTIVVEEGVAFANATAVTLNLSASDSISGVEQFRLSNNGTTWDSWESWENLSTSLTWTLSSGDGKKTVFLQIMDNASNVATYNATIVLDTTPPIISFQQANGTHFTSGSAIINWSATDANGNVSYEYSLDGAPFVSNGLATHVSLTNLTAGSHNITVRAIDGAGNAIEKKLQFNVSSTVSSAEAPPTWLILVIIAAAIGLFVVLRMHKKRNALVIMPQQHLPGSNHEGEKGEP